MFNSSFKNITLLFLGELFFLQKEGEPEYSLAFLIPKRWRRVTVPLAALPDRLFVTAESIVRTHKRMVSLCIAVGALLGGLFCAFLYREPAGYVVQRFYTDGREETSVYLESAEDPAWTGYRIMNYKDAETPMQVVSGRAVKLETARYYVGSALIGGFFGAAVAILWHMRRWRRKSIWAVTEISGYDI